ncbi:MAG: ATP phosphoribosyltransferase [Hyphomicrobiales bacterium]
MSDIAERPEPLVIAVPSKGRLQENAAAFFARAGLTLIQSRGARDYRGSLAGIDGVDILFLSASEIARELSAGGAHLGITGEDLIRESVPEAERRLAFLTPLGFGHANVVVAVPQAWIDVRNMADLEDVASSFRARHGRKLRVATKYVTLTRQFFAEHGISDYRIVESLGATEGAPAAGTAELIVDITTTGATLAANALKILDDGVILRSEANLVASLAAPWTGHARNAVSSILSRIAAEEEARTHREVHARFAVIPEGLGVEAAEKYEAILIRREAGLLSFQCAQFNVYRLAEWLMTEGSDRVSVSEINYIFAPINPLVSKLLSAIDT